jgi:hypothetical protein
VPKRVFFSFDFVEDLWRASAVRNRWVMDPAADAVGFWDAGFAENTPLTREALELFIDEQIDAAGVTVVLIGERTARCEHVAYAIRRSAELGRGLLGIYIDKAKDRYGSTSRRGTNPFQQVKILRDGQLVSLAEVVPTYDWVEDNGYQKLADWIAEARPTAVRYS